MYEGCRSSTPSRHDEVAAMKVVQMTVEQTEAARLASPPVFWHCEALLTQGRLQETVSAGALIGPECLTRPACLKEVDPTVLELFVLAEVASQIGASTTITLQERLELGRAVGNRVVDLLQAQPQLAGPAPLVEVKGLRAKVRMPLMCYVLKSAVSIDPDRLQSAAEASPELSKAISRVLKPTSMDFGDVLGSCGVASPTPRALLRVVPALWADLNTQNARLLLPQLCGFALRTAHGLDGSLKLIEEIRVAMQRHPMGERRFFYWATDDLAISLANALSGKYPPRTEHPVFLMLDAAVTSSSWPDRSKELGMEQAEGYPGRPLSAMADALNSLFAPEDRLELELIPPRALLEAVTLAPHAAGLRSVDNFWLGNPDRNPVAGTPKDFLDWAVGHTDGKGARVQAVDVEPKREAYERAIGVAATAELMSALAQRSMSTVLDQESVSSAAETPSTSTQVTARRSRAV